VTPGTKFKKTSNNSVPTKPIDAKKISGNMVSNLPIDLENKYENDNSKIIEAVNPNVN